MLNIILTIAILQIRQISTQTLYPLDSSIVTDLTPATFASTVYNGSSNAGYLVQFYLHTCGHCRAFAPIYELLARETQNWIPFARVTALNCGRTENQAICRENDVPYTPFLKYFPSTATSHVDGIVVEAYKTTDRLKDVFLDQILFDQRNNGIMDANWPNFEYLNDNETLFLLWQRTPSSQLGIIFDSAANSTTAAEVMANHFITARANRMTLRRARPTSELIQKLEIRNLPALATFSRTQLGQPIYISDQISLLGNMLLQQLGQVSITSTTARPSSFAQVPNPATTDAQRWYASEADILMATRRALFDEIVTFHDVVNNDSFDALLNFIQKLQLYFPANDEIERNADRMGLKPPNLSRSRQARFVFDDLQMAMNGRQNKTITAGEWTEMFRNSERKHGFPFTASLSGWQHCAGSEDKYRGYTCGLWTLFHTLTVQAYVSESAKNATDAKIGKDLLHGIQGWVKYFFSCKTCSEHFLAMTTNDLPIDQQINQLPDVVLYLWRAHNQVNKRLSGDATDDPLFPKRQFPMMFLCDTCQEHLQNNQSAWSSDAVLKYLLQYYTNVHVSPRPLYIQPMERPINAQELSAGPITIIED